MSWGIRGRGPGRGAQDERGGGLRHHTSDVMYRERAGLGGWLGGICCLYSLPGRVEPTTPPPPVPHPPTLDLSNTGSRGLACTGAPAGQQM